MCVCLCVFLSVWEGRTSMHYFEVHLQDPQCIDHLWGVGGVGQGEGQCLTHAQYHAVPSPPLTATQILPMISSGILSFSTRYTRFLTASRLKSINSMHIHTSPCVVGTPPSHTLHAQSHTTHCPLTYIPQAVAVKVHNVRGPVGSQLQGDRQLPELPHVLSNVLNTHTLCTGRHTMQCYSSH